MSEKKFALAALAALRARTSAVLALTLGIIFFVPAASAQAVQKRVALLVGVGEYMDTGISQLQGPPYDVEAMRDVLVRRWGFLPKDIKTLVNREATRANIMSELAALSRRSSAGDEVLVYFSGHGTSSLDASSGLPLPHGSGAFVPTDFKRVAGAGSDGLIVGRTDLVPIYTALEAGGRRIWAISDSCYAGQQVRSMQLAGAAALPARMIPSVVGGDAKDQRADLALIAQAPKPEPYPYRATAYLSASAEGEKARDIPQSMLAMTPTLDGKPHGAMTDALLRVLEGQIPGDLDGDGLLSLNEVHRATSEFMDKRAYGHTPQRLPSVEEDTQGIGNRPVIGMRGVAAAPKTGSLQPLRVSLNAVPASLATAISGMQDVHVVKPGEPADIVLQLTNERLRVISASGDLLAGMSASDTAKAVAQIRQLAWAQRLRSLAEKYRRGVLPAELDPAAQGGNFFPGNLISFVVRPDRQASLVLLNISSDGRVSVLYPYNSADTRPLPAGQAQHIPGSAEQQRIKVQEPFGMDFQFVFAFDEKPPGYDGLLQLTEVAPDNARLLAFERGLNAMAGKFTFAASSLRTLKP